MLIRFPAGSSVRIDLEISDVSDLSGASAKYILSTSFEAEPFLELTSASSQIEIPSALGDNFVRVYLLPGDTDGRRGWMYHELRIVFGVEGGVVLQGTEVFLEPTKTSHS